MSGRILVCTLNSSVACDQEWRCPWARQSPSWSVVCECGGGGGGSGRTELLPVPRFPNWTSTSRSLGASQPRLAAGPGSPAVPSLAWMGAAASMTLAHSGLSCPVHLDKLPLTGAQSLWSRRPPVASLPTQLPGVGSSQVARVGRGMRGEQEARPFPGRVVAPDLRQDGSRATSSA